MKNPSEEFDKLMIKLFSNKTDIINNIIFYVTIKVQILLGTLSPTI